MFQKMFLPSFIVRYPLISRHIFISCHKRQKNPSSSRWMQRHVNDPYVKQAARDGYRCRSAYKIIELDDKFHFLHPGKVVVDCGASPGSWTQVAVHRVVHSRKGARHSNKGLVIGVDLLDIREIRGAVLLSGHDFTSKETQEKILSLLPSTGADVILRNCHERETLLAGKAWQEWYAGIMQAQHHSSCVDVTWVLHREDMNSGKIDMAPNSTGNHSLDHEAILDLTETVFHFATKTLAEKGTFLCKLWDGRGTEDFTQMLRKSFSSVKKCKPRASRKESSEVYVYADGFSGV